MIAALVFSAVCSIYVIVFDQLYKRGLISLLLILLTATFYVYLAKMRINTVKTNHLINKLFDNRNFVEAEKISKNI